MTDFLNPVMPLLVVCAAAVAGLILSWLLRIGALRISRSLNAAPELSANVRMPLGAALSLTGARIALAVTTEESPWRRAVDHILLILIIIAAAWLAAAILMVIESMVLSRYRMDVADNQRIRRLRTQITLARRIFIALIVILALGIVLLTFPDVRALGAGLLASAGLLSIVAGLAAQTSLVNIFAGVQLAFGDAIRVDDVVVVEGEWGRIEEITMTYVVVHLWDDRRLILPSTYFTTTPFQNWTRRQSAVLGTVELDLDWRIPVEEMRGQLKSVLASTELWDGRVGLLQVTDAVGGFVRARILVSAADSATLFDLRCLVREELVLFLQAEHPTALPHQRWESVTPDTLREPHRDPHRDPSRRRDDAEQLFSGSLAAVQRSRAFTGPED